MLKIQANAEVLSTARSELDYYVAKWSFRRIQVIDFPSATLDFVFYIEGDSCAIQHRVFIISIVNSGSDQSNSDASSR